LLAPEPRPGRELAAAALRVLLLLGGAARRTEGAGSEATGACGTARGMLTASAMDSLTLAFISAGSNEATEGPCRQRRAHKKTTVGAVNFAKLIRC
jgi:hypothetical protein